jgi:hypothetical protein
MPVGIGLTKGSSEEVAGGGSRRKWLLELRPEGPAFNSHAREGARVIVLIHLENRRAGTYAMRCHPSLLCVAPAALISLDELSDPRPYGRGY